MEYVAVPLAGAVDVAAVPAIGAVPIVAEPFMKLTVPVGAAPALSAERVALRVMGLPGEA